MKTQQIQPKWKPYLARSSQIYPFHSWLLIRETFDWVLAGVKYENILTVGKRYKVIFRSNFGDPCVQCDDGQHRLLGKSYFHD